MILACAKKTNRKGQSKLFSVIDTLGRARARNKAHIVAEHSLRVCSERADAGLPTLLCCGQLATWGPFQGGWRDTSSRAALSFLLGREGKQNVASVSPCVPGVASGQALEGACCKGRDGRSRMAEGDPALPPWWLGEECHRDTGPDTGYPKRFWASCCRPCLHVPRKCCAETFCQAGSGGRAAMVHRGSPGIDTRHCSGRAAALVLCPIMLLSPALVPHL